jgi:DNA-binding GntR family transcriptional regulator
VLFEHCPNAHVLDLVHRGWARLRALRESTFSFVPGRAQGSVDEHSHLLDLAEGLVTFERNVGAQVAMLDPNEYRTTMQTLSLVEGYATAISAPLIDAADIARARAINDRMADSLEHFDPVAFTRLNLDFHGVLFENCPNEHVLDLVHRGWARLRALRESTFSFVPGRARSSVEEHSALLDLIESGAAALEIELAARNHRLRTLDAFLEQQNQRKDQA